MFAFISSFVTYLAIALVLVLLMIAGLMIGKSIRSSRDAKKAQAAEEEKASGQAE